MSDDLIRRRDAIKILACEMYAEAQSQGYEVDSIEDFMPEAKAWMNDAPTIDAVEVVRCKECRYKDMELCAMYKLVVAGVRKYDDFRSYGERKESE